MSNVVDHSNAGGAASPSARPNIVFLLPDQLRSDFLGSYGCEGTTTPHLDALAAGGTQYARAFSASPICVPARVSMLTGMDAIRNGVTSNHHFLRPDHAAMGIRTWPEILVDAGYHTAAIGKMHFHPWDARLGFQRRVIAEDKRWPLIRDDHYHALRRAGRAKVHAGQFDGYHTNGGAIVNDTPRELTADGFTADRAIEFLTTYGAEQPFALMVGFPGPHCPYDPHPDALASVDPARLPEPIMDTPAPLVRNGNVEGNKRPWNGVDYTDFPRELRQRVRTHYAALIHQIDVEVGRIVQTLTDTGLADDTIIIFASDHGDYVGDHGMVGKGSFFESSIRVPMIINGPGITPGVERDELVELRDITATMLALAGVDRPDHMDARVLPGIGVGADEPREIIIGAVSGGWMARENRWKLHKYDTGEILLFDIENDPSEQCNRADDPTCAVELSRLDRTLTQHLMASISAAAGDQRLGSLSDSDEFGREGWIRTYPAMMAPATRQAGSAPH